MKKAYVVGTNVSKSLSPTIFNYWFEKHKVQAEYFFKEIKVESFKNEIEKLLKEKDLCGLNITIPFKEKIINHIDTIDAHSKQIGAVNCVSKKRGVFEGTNTDWIGFEESIKWQEENNASKIEQKETALVVGYGGAAKAIIYSLSKLGFKKIRVFNRNFSKIQKLKNIIPHKLNEFENYFKEGNLVINTIPINYNDLKLKIPKTNSTKENQAHTPHGIDICYNKNTFFLEYFNSKKRFYGYHMLAHQAAPCFNKWFGIRPEVDAGLVSLLKKKLAIK